MASFAPGLPRTARDALPFRAGGNGKLSRGPLCQDLRVSQKGKREYRLMKPARECAPCILQWVYERAAVSASKENGFRLMRTVLGVLSGEFHSKANLGVICNKTIDAVHDFASAAAPHYRTLRSVMNSWVSTKLSAAREYLHSGKDPRQRFMRACYLASAANVAPIGAPAGALEFHEAERIIIGTGAYPKVMGDIYGAARNGREVLYVTDNAGEIGFDSLLIELLMEMGAQVTLVVKEPHFFEDATKEDASFFGLESLVNRILPVKGVFVPHGSATPLNDALRSSDLIISKGTGNYEAIRGEVGEKPTIYMLKVKCAPVAQCTGVGTGNFIVKLEG